jgi:hypothetical protein
VLLLATRFLSFDFPCCLHVLRWSFVSLTVHYLKEHGVTKCSDVPMLPALQTNIRYIFLENMRVLLAETLVKLEQHRNIATFLWVGKKSWYILEKTK